MLFELPSCSLALCPKLYEVWSNAESWVRSPKPSGLGMVSILKTSTATLSYGASGEFAACAINQLSDGKAKPASCDLSGLNSRRQLSFDPDVDIRASKAPELPDAYPMNLASTCHSLKRLYMDAKNSGCLCAIQEQLGPKFTPRNMEVRRQGGNRNSPCLVFRHIVDILHQNGHNASTS
jgi:hypothetical protein